MEFQRLDLPDVILLRPRVFEDPRGFFMETYKQSAFQAAGIDARFVQTNHSRSERGTLRGLHFQRAPMAQGKLVRVVRGAVLDVVVDIRKGSATYGRSLSVTLSDENRLGLWVPVGFAHGFCALEDPTDLLYQVTAEYSPENDAGIHALDPALGIEWPLRPEELIMSKKDQKLPYLKDLS